RISMVFRRGLFERRMISTVFVDRHNAWKWRQVELDAPCIGALGRQADIGERRRIAEYERCLGLSRQLRFQSFKSAADPMTAPGIYCSLISAKGRLQIAQHRKIVQRMNVAGDCQSEGPNLGAHPRIAAKEAW